MDRNRRRVPRPTRNDLLFVRLAETAYDALPKGTQEDLLTAQMLNEIFDGFESLTREKKESIARAILTNVYGEDYANDALEDEYFREMINV